MQVISSKDNEIVKKVKKLKEKKYRDSEGLFLIEGIKLIEEAIEENAKIKLIVVCEECISDGTIEKTLLYEIAKYECIYVTEKVFDTISEVTTPQGILAVVEKENKEHKVDLQEDFIIALDDIQDPGNLGTILRTADSAGLKQILISKNSADPYNPKVVRSTMGAIFRVKVIEVENLEKTLEEMQKQKYEIVVTALDSKESIYDIQYHKKIVVIGNEASGVSREIQELADRKVKIPMLGKTESLNASVAASIVIYEYVRNIIKKN